jgi:hypothetical protein
MLQTPGSRKEVLCPLLVESPGGCNMVIYGIYDLVYSFGVSIMCCFGYTLSFLCPLSNLRERERERERGGEKRDIM